MPCFFNLTILNTCIYTLGVIEVSNDEMKFEFMKELGSLVYNVITATRNGDVHEDTDTVMSILIGKRHILIKPYIYIY